HGRLQHPVRGQSGGRRPGRHRDEPTGLPQLRLGVEGDGVPHREDRGQTRRRLHPGRDPQRHHARDDGLLRAEHRLCRGEDPAVRVREVPAVRFRSDHADEVGGGGHGHRAHVQGSLAEGHPLAGSGPLWVRAASLPGGRRSGRGRRADPRAPAASRPLRIAEGVTAVFKRVDTCAAEFPALTPYLYSTYESKCESQPQARQKVMILGGGPNRIGQGIEFDYCCVHAALALRDLGYETIMVNCNPETVSTDYDTSDRLYFEPLTEEDVLAIVDTERRAGQLLGVVVQFGGQTPLKLALPLERAGVPILGTSPDAIDRAEDRERFKALLEKVGLKQPASGTARSVAEAVAVATSITYPVMVRPSYVLGGRAMEIIYDEKSLNAYIAQAIKASVQHPVLIDKYLEDAIEIDVDALSDGQRVVIGGIMEHIEEAGVHSGDAACSLPPYSLSPATVEEIRRPTIALTHAPHGIGLMTVP